MARIPFFGKSDAPVAPPTRDGDTIVAAPTPAHVPSASQLRREIRSLVEKREVDIRDLGGLTLEMVRREHFRPELLAERAEDILAGEERIRELDLLLNPPAEQRTSGTGGPACKCGTPLVLGARFCWRCGRPNDAAMPLVPCRRCHESLPADAEFCPRCGATTALTQDENETIVRPANPEQ
jgi:hypothetical protein